MCGIVLSFNSDVFVDLMSRNAIRGSFSHSQTTVDEKYNTLTGKEFGPFIHLKNISDKTKCLIGHVQAPTGGLVHEMERIHPAENGPYKLWHNGIIKTPFVRKLNEYFHTNFKWDTQVLLEYIIHDKTEALNKTDGAFACVLMKEGEYIEVFRNQTAPLYYSMTEFGLAISSTKFPMSLPLKANTVWKIDVNEKILVEISQFKNINTPYYFG